LKFVLEMGEAFEESDEVVYQILAFKPFGLEF
jgi:hypothetical protein